MVMFIPRVIRSPGTILNDLVRGLEKLKIGGQVETIKIMKNTEKSLGDQRRSVVSQTPLKDHQLMLV